MESRARRALTADQADLLRRLPSVDELLGQPQLAALARRGDRELLVGISRTGFAELRGRVSGAGTDAASALDSPARRGRSASMGGRVAASFLDAVNEAT